MSTLVTGATGLVGGALARRLLDDGEAVTVLARTPGKATALAERGARVVAGDLEEGPHLASALRGVERVVHCAARARDTGSMEPLLRDNVDAVVRLAELAARSGVRRFVHVSSISVYGLTSRGDIDEDAPLSAIESYPYAESKRLSELALGAADTGDMEVVVCRLGSVYGPGSHHWTVRPLTLMTKSPVGMLLVDGGNGLQNPIFVDDAATGLSALAFHEAAGEGAFHLTDDALSYRDFFAGYAAALGEPLRARAVSRTTALALARVMEGVARVRGREPLLTRIAVRVLCRRTVFSSQRLRERTGWRPQTSLADGQAACARWFRATPP